MAVPHSERVALELYGRLMDRLGGRIADGIHPNGKAFLADFDRAKTALSPGGQYASLAPQFQAELAEWGITVADLNALAAQVQTVVDAIEAIEATTNGAWFKVTLDRS